MDKNGFADELLLRRAEKMSTADKGEKRQHDGGNGWRNERRGGLGNWEEPPVQKKKKKKKKKKKR
jgi:hypothetical protein